MHRGSGSVKGHVLVTVMALLRLYPLCHFRWLGCVPLHVHSVSGQPFCCCSGCLLWWQHCRRHRRISGEPYGQSVMLTLSALLSVLRWVGSVGADWLAVTSLLGLCSWLIFVQDVTQDLLSFPLEVVACVCYQHFCAPLSGKGVAWLHNMWKVIFNWLDIGSIHGKQPPVLWEILVSIYYMSTDLDWHTQFPTSMSLLFFKSSHVRCFDLSIRNVAIISNTTMLNTQWWCH